jgi:hypothetical protein
MSPLKLAWVICFEGVLFLYGACRIDIINHEMMMHQLKVMLGMILFATGAAELVFSVINRKVLAGWTFRAAGGAINLLLSWLFYSIQIGNYSLIARLAGFGLLARVLLNVVQCYELCHQGIKKLELLVLLSGMVLLISFALIGYEDLGPLLISGLILTAFCCLTFFKALVCCKLRRTLR